MKVLFLPFKGGRTGFRRAPLAADLPPELVATRAYIFGFLPSTYRLRRHRPAPG